MSVETPEADKYSPKVEGYFVSVAIQVAGYRVVCMKCKREQVLTVFGLKDKRVLELLRQHRAEHGVEKGA